MQLWKLKDIYLGEPDGKKEATYKPNFDDFFLNYNSIYEKAIDQKTYLIIGAKGSGKTFLAELIKKKECAISKHFCEIISYKRLKYQEFIHFSNGDISPNQYTSIWEWSILIEIAKQLVKYANKERSFTEDCIRLKEFLEANTFELDIGADKILEITKGKHIQGKALLGVLKGEGGYSEDLRAEKGNYIQYITALRERVLRTIECSWSQFTLIIDELDDHFRAVDICKHSIISLIKVVDELNLEMLRLGTANKIIVLLRSDIFGVLGDSDLNKIRQGNSLTISWGNKNDASSPLFDLIFQKVKASVPLLQKTSRDQMFDLLFMRDDGHNRTNLRWLLSRTLLRPRDLINYLRILQNSNMERDSFEYSEFNRLERDYSICFLDECKDGLVGHFSQEEIDLFFRLLKKIGKPEFTYEELESIRRKNPRFEPLGDLEDILEQMFDFDIIGNRNIKTRHFDWHYRDNLAYFKADENIVIHAGLRKALGLDNRVTMSI